MTKADSQRKAAELTESGWGRYQPLLLGDLELSGQGAGTVNLPASDQGPRLPLLFMGGGVRGASAERLFLASHPISGPYERVLPQIHVYTGEGMLPRRTAMCYG